MLGKKETIQKTFRLDSKINDNLEVLSAVLERAQNDLVNVAIQNLLEENNDWLAKWIFVDYTDDFWLTQEDIKIKIDCVSVELYYINEYKDIKMKVEVEDEGRIAIQYEKTYDSDKSDINKELVKLYSYLNPNCKEIKEYLKNVNNYK